MRAVLLTRSGNNTTPRFNACTRNQTVKDDGTISLINNQQYVLFAYNNFLKPSLSYIAYVILFSLPYPLF